MFNPLEMFQAQGEAGIQAMAQQFGLSPEQTARAFEALMPALTLGLQRGAGLDPSSFARMFGMPEAARAAAPQGLEALTQMFGSAPLMQAVLRQASATSGVGAQVLRQMLPMMAGAVVTSIVHVMLNPPQAEPAQARPVAPPPPCRSLFGPAWARWPKAFMPGATVAPAPPPKPAPKSAGEKAGEAGSAMIEQMMRTGAEVQGNNIRAMQELFETFWPSSGQPAAPAPPKPEPSPPKPRRGRGPEGGTG
ncbi:DUF937 domain-containing protein [Methylobacterium sp. WL1]|uniref:DUF937 domain-containing protein n=1 Tax=Methylobacterium sp. WL1 TaxID=2603276 RepID=UPI0011C1E27F|nr:DUF937 domain-containing protein [Methylobacterium sp. WL1]QEE41869.1 DUF937 domain-containing protein [Methylobacterium sp. WL1]